MKKNKKIVQTNVRGGGNFSCRHPKLWSYIKSNIKAFFITGAIVFTITASATTVRILHSRQVRYKDGKSVEQALNELYQKADQLFAYHVGDEIKVNGIDFYVIADSPLKQDYVVALKKEPLTVAEVNQFGGVGTENNHVNRYTQSSVGTSYNAGGYGAMAFYSSDTCGYVNGQLISTNCIASYDDSDLKYVVDNWANDTFDSMLKEVDGSTARLLTFDEAGWNDASYIVNGRWYWLMNIHSYNLKAYYVASYGVAGSYYAGEYNVWVYNSGNPLTVRPVINVYKSAIQKQNIDH